MKIAVLGTGNMGNALIGGLKNKYGENVSVMAYDLIEKSTVNLNVPIVPPEQWFDDINAPDAIIIAVKPMDIGNAFLHFSKLTESLRCKPLWISIAAGVTLLSLQNHLPSGARICRVMPNTPALIGEGMSAYALNQNCVESDKLVVEKIFNACGKSVAVQEKMMNAITGLSGSGPAYVYLFIESLIEGGIAAGLPFATARECALQTVMGAAKMVLQTNESTHVLKMNVMSPAGTTVSGLMALESKAFKHSVISAVVDAAKRAEQLG
jgi:pyrroline-5-carboxylate reductase